MAQSDQTTGVFPKADILNQSIGGASIQLAMEIERTAYQLEQAGYQLATDTDPRLYNFLMQRPNYCEFGERAPASLTFNYARREEDGQTSYAVTWSPDEEGRYVASRIQYGVRTERGISRGDYYLYIPGAPRGGPYTQYCGSGYPTSCNVFSVPDGQSPVLRYFDTRIVMSSDDGSVLAHRRDLPDVERICGR